MGSCWAFNTRDALKECMHKWGFNKSRWDSAKYFHSVMYYATHHPHLKYCEWCFKMCSDKHIGTLNDLFTLGALDTGWAYVSLWNRGGEERKSWQCKDKKTDLPCIMITFIKVSIDVKQKKSLKPFFLSLKYLVRIIKCTSHASSNMQKMYFLEQNRTVSPIHC